jgi:hypothetical protein
VSRRRAVLRAARTTLVGVIVALSAATVGAPAARAAAPDLALRVDATYDVQPDAHQVLVTLAIDATNNLKDTASNRYVFDRAYLAVQPEATAFKVSGKLGRARVSVSATEPDHTLLLITFGGQLKAGATTRLTLTYALADDGGAPDRSVRVGTALVAFPVWAFATAETPGSTTTVDFPAGYAVEFVEGSMPAPRTLEDGRQSWTSGSLDDPLAFYAYVRGSRTAETSDVSRIIDVQTSAARVTFRAWIDDQDWLDRVRALTVDVLPQIGAALGLPWPVDGSVTIEEVLVRSTDGHAGIYDPAERVIRIAYYADDGVIAHELAHAWFNGRFVAERWVAEGFASYYAEIAASAAGRLIVSPSITPALQAAAIPLNAWSSASAGDTAPADQLVESYGYAASLAAARAIAIRAGPDGMRAVWRAVEAGQWAYQPVSGAEELGAGPPDWRTLLDLFENVTGRSFTDIWEAWVLRPSDDALLPQRAAARTAYQDLIVAAGDWGVPVTIRDAMRTWHFDLALAEIAQARALLSDRDELDARAAAAGLVPPGAIRASYAAGDLGVASAGAAAERTAIERIEAAAAARPAQPGWLGQLGLFGAEPDADLQAARSAFAQGDMVGAASSAAAAETTWRSADDVGRGRVLGIVAILLALVLMAGLLVGSHRRARRRRPHAHPLRRSGRVS